MKLALVFLVALALAACGDPQPAPTTEPTTGPTPAPATPEVAPAAPAPAADPVAACGPASAAGFCGITFGMMPQDAKTTFPTPLTRAGGDVNTVHDPQMCFQMYAGAPLEGVSFLVEQDKVGRVDVEAPGVTNPDGFGVGSMAANMKTKYGAALTEQPNKYEPTVTELMLTDGAGKQVFEIANGVVRAWRAGVPPLIDYVEHCG